MIRPRRNGPSKEKARGLLWKMCAAVENWLPAACPVDHANNAARCCSRLRTQWSAGSDSVRQNQVIEERRAGPVTGASISFKPLVALSVNEVLDGVLRKGRKLRIRV